MSTRRLQLIHSGYRKRSCPSCSFTPSRKVLVSAPIVAWSRKHLKNLRVVNIGPGIHDIQEDNPHRIGQETG